MTSTISPNQNSRSSVAEALLNSMGKLGYGLRNMEEMQKILINSDHNTIKFASEKFCRQMHNMISTHSLPIFDIKLPLSDFDFNDIHRFYTILNLFNFVLDVNDLKVLLKPNVVEIEIISEILFDSLKKVKQENNEKFKEMERISTPALSEKITKMASSLNSLSIQTYFSLKNIINALLLSETMSEQAISALSELKNSLIKSFDDFFYSYEYKSNYLALLLCLANAFMKIKTETALEMAFTIFDSLSRFDSSMLIDVSDLIIRGMKKVDFNSIFNRLENIYFSTVTEFPTSSSNALQLCILDSSIFHIFSENKVLKEKHLSLIFLLYQNISKSSIECEKKVNCLMILLKNASFSAAVPSRDFALPIFTESTQNIIDDFTFYYNPESFEDAFTESGEALKSIALFNGFIETNCHILKNFFIVGKKTQGTEISCGFSSFDFSNSVSTFVSLLQKLHEGCRAITNFTKKINYEDGPEQLHKYYEQSAQNTELLYNINSCKYTCEKSCRCMRELLENAPTNFTRLVIKTFTDSLLEPKKLDVIMCFSFTSSCFLPIIIDRLSSQTLALQTANSALTVLSSIFTDYNKEEATDKERAALIDSMHNFMKNIVISYHSFALQVPVFDILTQAFDFCIQIGANIEDFINTEFTDSFLLFDEVAFPKTKELFNFIEYLLSKNKKIAESDIFIDAFIPFMSKDFDKCMKILSKTSFADDFFANRRCFMKIANVIYNCLPKASVESRVTGVQVLKTLLPSQFNQLHVTSIDINNSASLSLISREFTAITDTETFVDAIIDSRHKDPTPFICKLFTQTLTELFSHEFTKRAHYISHKAINGLITITSDRSIIRQVIQKATNKSIFFAHLLFSLSMVQSRSDLETISTTGITDEKIFAEIVKCIFILFQFYPYHNGVAATNIILQIIKNVHHQNIETNVLFEYVNELILHHTSLEISFTKENYDLPEIICFNEQVRNVIIECNFLAFEMLNNNEQLNMLKLQKSSASRVFLASCINPATTDVTKTCAELMEEGKFETAGLLLRISPAAKENLVGEIRKHVKQLLVNDSDALSFYIAAIDVVTSEELETLCNSAAKQLQSHDAIKQTQAAVFFEKCSKINENFVKKATLGIFERSTRNTQIKDNSKLIILFFKFLPTVVLNYLVNVFKETITELSESTNTEKTDETRGNINAIIRCILETKIIEYINENGLLGSIIDELIFCLKNYPSKIELVKSALKTSKITNLFIEKVHETKVSIPMFKIMDRDKSFREKVSKLTEELENNLMITKVNEKTVLSLILYTFCNDAIAKHTLDSRIRAIYPKVIKVFAKSLPSFKEKDFNLLIQFYSNKFYVDVIDLFTPVYNTKSPALMKLFSVFIQNNFNYSTTHVFDHIKTLEVQDFPQFTKFVVENYISLYCPDKYDPFIDMFKQKLTNFVHRTNERNQALLNHLMFKRLHPYIDDDILQQYRTVPFSKITVTKDFIHCLQASFHRLAKYPNLAQLIIKRFPTITPKQSDDVTIHNEVITNLLLFLKGITNPAQLRGYYNIINDIIVTMGKSPELFVNLPINKCGEFVSRILCVMVRGYNECQDMYQDIDIFPHLGFLLEKKLPSAPFIKETFEVAKQIIKKEQKNQKVLRIILNAIGYIACLTSANIPEDLVDLLVNMSLERMGISWAYALYGVYGIIDNTPSILKKIMPLFYKKKMIYRLFPIMILNKVEKNHETYANFAIAFSKLRNVNISFDETYFIELILKIKSSANFDIIEKELNKAKSSIDSVESQRFIINLFVAIFKSGIENHDLKELIEDAFSNPEIIKIFKDYPNMAKLIFDKVSEVTKIRMISNIFIPNVQELSPQPVLDNPGLFNLTTSIITGLFSEESNVRNFAPLLRSKLTFEIKRNFKAKDISTIVIKSKSGFKSTYSSTLHINPKIPLTQMEVIASRASMIPISSMLTMLNLKSCAITNMPKREKENLGIFEDEICESIENIFRNTNQEERAAIAKTVDATLSTKSPRQEFAIRASLADEFKHALLGDARFNYILPHSAAPAIYNIYKKLRSLCSATTDEQKEKIHEQSLACSKYLFFEEKRKFEFSKNSEITPENIKKFAVFTHQVEALQDKQRLAHMIHSALRIHSSSDILLSLLLEHDIDPIQTVPFDWSPLFLKKRSNIPFINPGYYIAMADEFIPTDARPSIDEFKGFLKSFLDSPKIKEVSEIDAIDYSQSEQFRRAMANGLSFFSQKPPQTKGSNFVKMASFNELRAPLIEEDVKALSALATVSVPKANNINISMRLSNGKSANYVLFFRTTFSHRYFIFTQAISRILRRSPISSQRSMIIPTPHFFRVDDSMTLVRTNGFPLISEVRLFKPTQISKHTHGTPDFFSTQQKCIWQSTATARVSALSILQVIMSSPVPNPYNVIIDISTCSCSLSSMNVARTNEIPYIFPRLTGGLAHFMSFTPGQLVVNMKAAAVALSTFSPKVSFLARSIMNYKAKELSALTQTLRDLSDISVTGYETSQVKIKALIDAGSSLDNMFAIPWL